MDWFLYDRDLRHERVKYNKIIKMKCGFHYRVYILRKYLELLHQLGRRSFKDNYISSFLVAEKRYVFDISLFSSILTTCLIIKCVKRALNGTLMQI